MRCQCKVEPRIVRRRKAQPDSGQSDILTYRCPRCHREWEEQMRRTQQPQTQNE